MRTPKRNNKFCSNEVPFTRPVERAVHVTTHTDLLYLREELNKCAQDEPLFINLDVEYWTAQKVDEWTLFLSERDFNFILGAIRPINYDVCGVDYVYEFRKEPRVIRRIRFTKSDVRR